MPDNFHVMLNGNLNSRPVSQEVHKLDNSGGGCDNSAVQSENASTDVYVKG